MKVMMPCVTNDPNDKTKEFSAAAQRKTIYKPKYHAFSIDSIVGNNFNNGKTSNDGVNHNHNLNHSDRHSTDTQREKDDNDEHDSDEEYETNLKIITSSRNSTPNTSQSNSGHHKRDCGSPDKQSSNSSATRLVKNDILRSYMTAASHHYMTSHHNSSSHYAQHSGNGGSHHHLIGPQFDIIRNAIDEKINNNSNSSSNHDRNSGIAAGIQALNANQYYCNQLYCRPYDNRFMHNVCHNAFLPSVCDYESLLIKNGQHDMCTASSFSPYRKPKRVRTAFSPGQLLRLEEIFERNRYVVGCERKQLARDLNLSETQIKVWFQNRRTKHKRERHQEDRGGGQRKMISSPFSSKSALNLNPITGNNEMDFIQ